MFIHSMSIWCRIVDFHQVENVPITTTTWTKISISICSARNELNSREITQPWNNLELLLPFTKKITISTKWSRNRFGPPGSNDFRLTMQYIRCCCVGTFLFHKLKTNDIHDPRKTIKMHYNLVTHKVIYQPKTSIYNHLFTEDFFFIYHLKYHQ